MNESSPRSDCGAYLSFSFENSELVLAYIPFLWSFPRTVGGVRCTARITTVVAVTCSGPSSAAASLRRKADF